MPLYEFYNEELGESYEMMMTIANKEKYLKKNPHIKQVIGAPNIVGGVGDRVKTDSGFKEVLSKIGDAHPGSNVHAKHGSKDIKREKSIATIKKHAAIQSRKNDTTKTNLLELHELENIDLKTITVDGKRYYTAEGAEDSIRYPSVTTVTGLHSKDQIKLWRKRVGEEKANKITRYSSARWQPCLSYTAA